VGQLLVERSSGRSERVTPRVGIIGLGEAGNLGDDLILIAAVAAVTALAPDVKVRHLTSGHAIDWDRLPESLRLGDRVESVAKSRELPGARWAERTFQDVDAVLFGGGGLLQDVHHPYRPYHWLRFLPDEPRVPSLAVGLGLGPLGGRWREWLAQRPMPFDACFVRDEDSAVVARSLGWTVGRCQDFVDGEFLRQLTGSTALPERPVPRLGVSLRAWPGLTASQVAESIAGVVRREGLAEVAFFVLEDRGGGRDRSFTQAVIDLLGEGISSCLYAYRADELTTFLHEMSTCSAALSMKLHASVIWHHLGATLYPVVYAPKVAALFGRPYEGLEILDEPTVPPVSEDVPRAQEVVRQWLERQIGSRGAEGWRLSRMERLSFQVRAAALDLVRKYFVRHPVGEGA
jgi:polysaccharide pyruvyl transferase WcaK-like protein